MARATLDAAQAVIAAGGTAIVASPAGSMVPDLLRLRASHLELPEFSHPVRARYTLPGRLATSLRSLDVTVVQARSPATALVARQVARRLDLKWIATLYRPFSTRGLMNRLIERRQGYADAVVAVSDHIARDALQHFPTLGERLHTIPPGINFDRFDPAIVRADRVIRLAGELRGRVQIGPYVEDMPAAYMLADVVVATGGINRGFSRTLVEAQAMGRPVVTEDGGGPVEAVRSSVTGWLAAAGNPAALAEAISQALSLSVEQRAELARTAQEHVRGRFALAHSNQRLLHLYEQLSD
jgi:glycosyltransferase involved in cell wall biosynthesis